MLIGYARCSTAGQDTEVQVRKLLAEGVPEDRVYVDHGFSGKTMTRDGYLQARAALRTGDTLVVPEMSRLARNAAETLRLMQELTDDGISLKVGGLLYNPADPMSKMFMTFLAAVAEAEGGWVSIRTSEAMARPSVRRRLKGKQSKLSAKQDAIIAQHLEEGDLTHQEVADLFNISRSGIYRARDRHMKRKMSPSVTQHEAT